MWFTLILCSACAHKLSNSNLETPPVGKIIQDLKPTVILISLDGFRHDYLDRHKPPMLTQLAQRGVVAKKLQPVFPTLTFPNHYTLVTGLFVERHGIIGNTMKDPEIPDTFSLSNQSVVQQSAWWEGEPLWVTASKQGQKSGTMFWPGSSSEIKGVRPTYWKIYDPKITGEQRVDQVLSWLDLEVLERPTFLTLYFESPDAEGHGFGPDSSETAASIGKVDQHLARLLSGLKQRQIEEQVHIIVVSDHGMSEVKAEQVVPIDSLVDTKIVEVVGAGALAGLIPPKGQEELWYQKLRSAHKNIKVYRQKDIPARYQYKNHRRVQPLLLVADGGWYLSGGSKSPPKGAHGYDPALSDMQGFFVAAGPAFKNNFQIKSLRSVDVYELVAHLLKLTPALNDGKFENVRRLLK